MPGPGSLVMNSNQVVPGEPSKEWVCLWAFDTQSQMATKLPTHCRYKWFQEECAQPRCSSLGSPPAPALAFLSLAHGTNHLGSALPARSWHGVDTMHIDADA